jgi:hypothetical protein
MKLVRSGLISPALFIPALIRCVGWGVKTWVLRSAVGHKIVVASGETNLKKCTLELGGKSAMIICKVGGRAAPSPPRDGRVIAAVKRSPHYQGRDRPQ